MLTNSSSNSSLTEPRFRPDNVERFRAVIQALVHEKLPLECSIAGSNLSPVTYAARLSDAIKAVIDQRVPILSLEDYNKLIEIRRTFKITPLRKTVLIELRKKPLPVTPDSILHGEVEYSILASVTPQDAHAIAHLLGARLLKQPARLFNVSDELLNELTTKYDIAARRESNGSVILQ